MEFLFLYFFSVACYNLLIPFKRFFFISFATSLSFIIYVHIYKTITFFHFTSRCAYQVNAAPGRVSQQAYTIFFHRCFHSFDMFSQILDPVIIFHISVFIRFSSSALYRSSIIFFALFVRSYSTAITITYSMVKPRV